MKAHIKSCVLTALLCVGLAAELQAQGTVFTYEGFLRDTSTGRPVTDVVSMRFRIYAGANPSPFFPVLWQETHPSVPVTNGLFSVVLGRIDPADETLFTGGTRWLGIAVNGGAEMLPRTQITAVPYAITAGHLTGVLPANALSGTYSSPVTFNNAANSFTGNGGGLTNLNANNLASGTVPGARLAGTYNNAVTFDNSANSFFGNGLGLNALSASSLTAGTVPSARLSGTYGNVLRLNNQANQFTGAFTGDGSALENVPGILRWEVVQGTSVQAWGNTGYIVTNSQQVTITLPWEPVVSEIFRISGAGSGGWKLVQNPLQSIIGAQLDTAAGVNWTPRGNGKNWQSMASSADGNKLIGAVAISGQLFTSADSGVTWTQRADQRGWHVVASSADGSKLVAAVGGTAVGQIYTSIDSGLNWTPRQTDRAWSAVASSADGSKLVATVDGGQIYTSTDSGVTWTPRESNRSWRAVASSGDGSKLVAIANSRIYTSIDSGVSWTTRSILTGIEAIVSSADGSKLLAAAGGCAVCNGLLYTSVDSGITWTPRESVRAWMAIASSADGSKLVAGVYGGQIYTSTDSGATWIPRESNRLWRVMASSADGRKLVAAPYGGQIYTSNGDTTTGGAGYLIGAQATTLELQYVGNNQFLPLSHEGTITGF